MLNNFQPPNPTKNPAVKPDNISHINLNKTHQNQSSKPEELPSFAALAKNPDKLVQDLNKTAHTGSKQDVDGLKNIQDKAIYAAGKNKKIPIKKPKKRFGIRVSIFYFLMAAAMFFWGQGYEIVVYTIAMVLHELAHAETAERLGYTLSGFRLMPYGASLTGNFESARFRDELVIAVAGPLFSLLLAVPAVAMWWLVPSSYYITKLFVTANLFIALFNLLPVFPLDGGRILLAFLSEYKPRQRVYRVIRIFGFVVATAMAGLFVLSLFFGVNFSFAVTAVFIFVSSVVPDKNSRYQRLYSMAYRSEKLMRGLPVREIMVPESSTVLRLTKMLSGGYYTRFVVMGADMSPITVITESQLEEVSLKIAPNERIADSKYFLQQKKK